MKASLDNLHHQDTDWQRELDFYKEELQILAKRLEEVASKNNEIQVTARIEHFQNKFIILREQLDILKHDINTREGRVEEVAKERPEHVTEKINVATGQLLGRMKSYAGDFADTRFEFNKFLAEVL